MQTNSSVIRLPAIVTDIDGVLVRQKNAIERSAEAIKFLKTPLSEIDRERFSDVNECIPFACLTNSGSGTERLKAESISNVLGITEPSQRLKGEEVIMNFTPLRPILEQYREKLVLLGGVGDLGLLAEDFGLKQHITDEEYCALYPKLVPFRGRPESGEEFEKFRAKIAKRLGIEVDDLIEPLQVHAVFMLNDPIKWDERVQVICDLLSTPDGKIAQKMPDVAPETHIPVYCTNNDLLFAGEFRLVRMTFGCFNETLRNCYKLIYKRDLHINMYGKPCQLTFDFAEKFVKERTKFEISNFYMIGDNPKSDIRGGNGAGWRTILVKTGVFQTSEEIKNDPEDPATYVVEDFADAIKLICELEGLKHTIN